MRSALHRPHGSQEDRHFNAYYDDHCYLPLYAFVGDFPLWAQLRTADHNAASDVVPALEQIVAAIRQRCRKVRINIRGDSGFCHEEILAWCESQWEVYYCLELAKNSVMAGAGTGTSASLPDRRRGAGLYGI